MMILHILATLLACLATVRSRDASRIKTVPTITNSLVNLGKMEISFHFNGKTPDAPLKLDHLSHPSSSFPFSRPLPIIEESCPCSGLSNVKDSFLSNPSEIIKKILTSNDLFNKDPDSTFCCDSHDHIQENTMFFEIAPKHTPMKYPLQNNPLRLPPFSFDRLIPNKPGASPFKSKSVEIFLFPKRKDLTTVDFSKMAPMKKGIIAKKGIQVVGDKELKSNVKLPTSSEISSVKKDLSILVKNEDMDIEKNNALKSNTPVNNPNTL